jgi:hypothetical protein
METSKEIINEIDIRRIDELNRKLISSLDEQFPIDLSNGKMGICNYFY